jgi:hypothetical protein
MDDCNVGTFRNKEDTLVGRGRTALVCSYLEKYFTIEKPPIMNLYWKNLMSKLAAILFIVCSYGVLSNLSATDVDVTDTTV